MGVKDYKVLEELVRKEIALLPGVEKAECSKGFDVQINPDDTLVLDNPTVTVHFYLHQEENRFDKDKLDNPIDIVRKVLDRAKKEMKFRGEFKLKFEMPPKRQFYDFLP